MKLTAPVPEPTAPCCVAAGRLCDQHVAALTPDQQRAVYAARRAAARGTRGTARGRGAALEAS